MYLTICSVKICRSPGPPCGAEQKLIIFSKVKKKQKTQFCKTMLLYFLYLFFTFSVRLYMTLASASATTFVFLLSLLTSTCGLWYKQSVKEEAGNKTRGNSVQTQPRTEEKLQGNQMEQDGKKGQVQKDTILLQTTLWHQPKTLQS